MTALLLTQMRPSLLKAVTPSQLSHEISTDLLPARYSAFRR